MLFRDFQRPRKNSTIFSGPQNTQTLGISGLKNHALNDFTIFSGHHFHPSPPKTIFVGISDQSCYFFGCVILDPPLRDLITTHAKSVLGGYSGNLSYFGSTFFIQHSFWGTFLVQTPKFGSIFRVFGTIFTGLVLLESGFSGLTF